MSIKIDLRIFFFGILFFLTKQIEIYALLMLFAFLHELGHLLAGLLLGFKPKSMGINPLGFQITFQTKIEDDNKEIEKGNKSKLKKIAIFLAGPIINLIIAITFLFINQGIVASRNNIIYSNLLLAIFNLLPIYPLDGGRILKEIIHIYKGKKETYKIMKNISKIMVIFLTILVSILILYVHNIAFLFILAYLWYLVIKNQKEYEIFLFYMEKHLSRESEKDDKDI